MRKLIVIAAIASFASPAYAQGYPDPRPQFPNPWASHPQPDLHEQQRQDLRNGKYGRTYEQTLQLERDANRSRAERTNQNPYTYRQPGIVVPQSRYQQQYVNPYNYAVEPPVSEF